MRAARWTTPSLGLRSVVRELPNYLHLSSPTPPFYGLPSLHNALLKVRRVFCPTLYVVAVAGCLDDGQESIFTICSHLMHETSDRSQDEILLVRLVWVVSATMMKMENHTAVKATVTYSCALKDEMSLNNCCA